MGKDSAYYKDKKKKQNQPSDKKLSLQEVKKLL